MRELYSLAEREAPKAELWFYMYYDKPRNLVRMAKPAPRANLYRSYKAVWGEYIYIDRFPYTKPIVDFINENVDWLKAGDIFIPIKRSAKSVGNLSS